MWLGIVMKKNWTFFDLPMLERNTAVLSVFCWFPARMIVFQDSRCCHGGFHMLTTKQGSEHYFDFTWYRTLSVLIYSLFFCHRLFFCCVKEAQSWLCNGGFLSSFCSYSTHFLSFQVDSNTEQLLNGQSLFLLQPPQLFCIHLQ